MAAIIHTIRMIFGQAIALCRQFSAILGRNSSKEVRTRMTCWRKLKMKSIIIGMMLLVGLAAAAGYNDWQQGAIQGLKIGFHMGEMYTQASQGVNITGFNAEVDKYNKWVQQNFGNDQALMMPKMSGPIDLSKPYMAANNTTGGGIVHAIDGSSKMGGPSYTTNDMNLLPASVTESMYKRSQTTDPNSPEYLETQGNYLGGV
jgi:hypothetical protein